MGTHENFSESANVRVNVHQVHLNMAASVAHFVLVCLWPEQKFMSNQVGPTATSKCAVDSPHAGW